MEPVERTDEAFEDREKLTVLGAQLKAGDSVPPLKFASRMEDGGQITVDLSDSYDGLVIVHFVNSLAPGSTVCIALTKELDELYKKNLSKRKVGVYTISVDDRRFLQGFSSGANIKHPLFSAKKHTDLLTGWGVFIKEWKKPQRCFALIRMKNSEGTIIQIFYVKDQGSESEARDAMTRIVEKSEESSGDQLRL